MTNFFLKLYQHLLPRAQAWTIVIEKTLREFFLGLSFWAFDVVLFFDLLILDILPTNTRQLDLWEQQFGILTNLENEQDRRTRLDAQWKAVGGQSPSYIQGVLRDAGFDVYVHEWWFTGFDWAGAVICGNAAAVCGSPDAVANNSSAQTLQIRDPRDYVDEDSILVNKILFSKKIFISSVVCGNAEAVCGSADSLCGASDGFDILEKKYIIPSDPDLWVHFWYVGGPVFGQFADVPIERKDEFETLILKIKPRQTWVGLFINYV